MQADEVAVGVVETAENLLEHDPQLEYRLAYWEVKHPEIGTHRTPVLPISYQSPPMR